MRLTPSEIQAIKDAARYAFGADSVARLFGSRVHDDLKGGDIDLIIEVDPGQDGLANEARFTDRLFALIDEQKVDLVMIRRGEEPSDFARLALKDAVALI